MPYIGNIVQDFSVSTAMLNTDSVTSIKVLDGTIVNADINDSAAIAGTKISPDFGSQAIVTTGAITGQDFRTASSQTFFLTSGDDWNFRTITGSTKLTITNTGQVDFAGNVDCNAGLDVTGDITATGDITISNSAPRIIFTDSNNNDFAIIVDGNDLNIQDTTAGENRLNINSSGVVSCNDGLAVTGVSTLNGGNVTNSLEINGTGGHELYSYHDSGGVGWATGTGGSYGELLYLDESGSTARLYTGGTERFRVSGTEAVVNETGANVDFRVEGNGDVYNFLVDASTDRVGIGTNTPQAKLEIKGTNDGGNFTALHLRNAGGDGSDVTINMISSTDQTNTAARSFIRSERVGSAPELAFGIANIERMRLTGSSLSFAGTKNGNAYEDATLIFNIKDSNGNSKKAQILSNKSSDIHSTLEFGTTVSNSFDERMRIHTNGVVGIGTTAPEGKGLDITASRTNNYAATSDTRNLAHLILRNSSDGAGRFAALSFINGGGTQAEGSINLVQTADYNGDLAFKMRTAVSTWGEVMRIHSTGLVEANTSYSDTYSSTTSISPHFRARNQQGADNIYGGLQLRADRNNGAAAITNIACLNTSTNFESILVFQSRNADGNFSEKLRIRAGGGLTFNGDTAATNALNDYEEGTAFTSTGNATVNQAAYTKVGKMVTISFRISVTAGNTQQMTLPFAHSGNHGDHVLGVVVTAGTFKEIILDNHSAFTLTAGFSKGTLTYPTQT